MSFAGRWTGGQYLSAFYLLASTALMMMALFVAEDIMFPTACHTCESQSDQVELQKNIGKFLPLLQNSPAEEVGQQEFVTSETSLAKDRNVEALSEANPTEKAGTGIAKPTQNSDDEQNALAAPTAQAPPPIVRSVEYYTNGYQHPAAKLRKLTAEDGAPRIQSNISPTKREITIVTQTSADRLPALESACLQWGGALVVAVHVRLQSEIKSVYDQVKQMHARMEEQSGCRLDVQLVTEDGFETDEDALRALYPVNALRNVALGMANTELVFLLDADFKPSPRLHAILTTDDGKYQDLLRQATEGKQLFVVPAFESKVRGRKVAMTVPETMEDLRERWENKTIDCFHCRRSPTGHMPTMFERFFNLNTTDPYPISYRDGFEPYVIGALDAIPQYDPRFRGYGENKVSHLYSCAADGMGFQVLPNVFVFELPHAPSEAHDSYKGKNKDPDQRLRIVGLYRQFKKEIENAQLKKDAQRYRRFLKTAKGYN